MITRAEFDRRMVEAASIGDEEFFAGRWIVSTEAAVAAPDDIWETVVRLDERYEMVSQSKERLEVRARDTSNPVQS